MKKTAVVGLGIIGASIAGALTKAGFDVHGTDLNERSVSIAIEKGFITQKAGELSLYDVVFIAVPPRATKRILQTSVFKDGALVTDICGVKSEMEKAVNARKTNFRYVGLHPMAGKETSGIESASPDLFRMANLVITRSEKTDETAVEEAKTLAKAMRFGKIVECTAEEHDKKIALTSQLAHIVSNAYVKSPQVKNCSGFTGGSFQDMTRIAGVDERTWTELYMSNRDAILEELDGIIEHLTVYRDALEEKDEDKLSEALKEGRLIRENIKYGRE